MAAVFGEEHLFGIGGPGVFFAVGGLPEGEGHVFNRHLAEALVELNIVAYVVGPYLPISGYIPTFGQHRAHETIVKVIHTQSLGNGYGAVQEDLRVADQLGVAHVGPQLFLANGQRAG